MERYLKMNGISFSVEEVCAALGIKESVASIELCQDGPKGELAAVSYGYGNDAFSSLTTEFRLPEAAKSIPILLSCSSLDAFDGKEEMKTFLYSRSGNYIAFAKADLRPDSEEENSPAPAKVHLSGDPGEPVTGIADNPFVLFE